MLLGTVSVLWRIGFFGADLRCVLRADRIGSVFACVGLEGDVLGGTILEIIVLLAVEGCGFFVCGLRTLPALTGALACGAVGFFAGVGAALRTGFRAADF